MRYVLVLQWPGSTTADFDELIAMEDALDGRLAAASVDGHDFGSGEMNIFIGTDDPSRAFVDAQGLLAGRPRWAEVRAAYRDQTESAYVSLWPPGSIGFTVV